jgi:hypothetical protein
LQTLQGFLFPGFPVDAAAGVFNQLFGFQASQPGIGRAFRVKQEKKVANSGSRFYL